MTLAHNRTRVRPRAAPATPTERPVPGRPARAEDARAAAPSRVVGEVSANLELDEVFDDVLESTQQLFGTDAAGLWLLTPTRFPFCLASHHDLPQELIDAVAEVTSDSPVLGLRAINERRSMVLEHPEQAPTFADLY